MLIDLGHFKQVNDTLGHQVGDEVLVEITKRLDAIANRHVATVARLGGDGQLRRAVSQRRFVPWFQPVVDLESGHPVAIEALTRWQHPDGTIIGPGEFVEPMERLGLLDAMSWSILEQALDALVEFDRTLGPAAPHNLALNVTPAMLGADGAADRITGLLATRHIPPERLTLELGLSVVAEGIETTEQQRTLADMGIRTGQGYLFAAAAPAHHVQTHFADARTAVRS